MDMSNSKFFLSRGKSCAACGHLKSQKDLNDGICNKCAEQYSEKQLEETIISRATSGKSSSIAWLQAHNFEEQ